MICHFLSVGPIFVSAIYVGFVVLVHYQSPVDCLDEPCLSEGVDNRVINWATDFFVSAFCLFLGLHLSLTHAVRKAGILAQIFMAGSFALQGIAHWMYANSGEGDEKGMLGYWVLVAFFSMFFVLSAFSHAHLAVESTKAMSSLRRPCCGLMMLKICRILLLLSLVGTLSGCIWCSVDSTMHVESVIDEYDWGLDNDESTCIRIVNISKFSLLFSYALLWFPMAMLLKFAALDRPANILGLTTPMAAGSICVYQWTVGSIFICAMALVAFVRGEDFLETFTDKFGAEIFHYGMVLTMYCAHNVSWTLLLIPQRRQRVQSPLSNEIDRAEKGILKKKQQPLEAIVEEPEQEERRVKTISFEEQ